ncbi:MULTISPECIES: iron-hydroxamate ABC transporter substrate-binding protein [unclassified Planococcus (in: firmicutes)]|uniref:iron-hydroxamate ABC transporter substrate-binding protein n=1 Tax=unclassified Planococcus (in: firmicutes) TaxID=2662419 RepID=UPI000C32AB81|nr:MULTISPECIES: iron-hydroxamate ABC transporter substrate-binding protein [unclassified Planococcus (in: firmicutes)]AUD15151.1 ABC transporter substrate-binding protein [Planococcus sp. MB-3u-03]PKG46283.1 ABC transporter substrate-binding protein [Planococcus sp. Urea-trap-24]PKG90069.1 ABC transporter substrate-binding protein [Planococcus sp. Urea-3u-39]PKH35781.1 ABC transporter substrate-binding protein [Planococcus sp. MB-3u-09]
MKKLLFLSIALLVMLALAACGSTEETTEEAGGSEGEASGAETIQYESENGTVEVPADPQRVVALAYGGNVMSLDVPLAGIDAWAIDNPNYEPYLDGVEEVSEENLEKIIELDPDLIIGYSTLQNVDKLEQIAPTVTFTYGKVDYLTQHLEIGKLLNKEDEAQAFVDDFKERAQAAGEEIKAEIGEDATVSVIENFDKQLYVYGDNWGRGTEILYQEMGLNMPEKVKEMALTDGYYALSQEVLPEYMGDYVIFSKDSEQDNSFQETDLYQNTPAVKNDQVFEADAKKLYFNDPISLDYQLELFQEKFLGQ